MKREQHRRRRNGRKTPRRRRRIPGVRAGTRRNAPANRNASGDTLAADLSARRWTDGEFLNEFRRLRSSARFRTQPSARRRRVTASNGRSEASGWVARKWLPRQPIGGRRVSVETEWPSPESILALGAIDSRATRRQHGRRAGRTNR